MSLSDRTRERRESREASETDVTDSEEEIKATAYTPISTSVDNASPSIGDPINVTVQCALITITAPANSTKVHLGCSTPGYVSPDPAYPPISSPIEGPSIFELQVNATTKTASMRFTVTNRPADGKLVFFAMKPGTVGTVDIPQV